ncbi:fimbrial protein [Klebsiella quasipneumoniae subsp. similipneumoniae]|uniref:fimbrial protein n=1 Tax=Klebsiella quasipneumoniae TaxID=1463165 RepID=UPI00202D01A2|nr:fimbrial protein [Klebsiella quasipneumoniae]MCL9975591.1 fimbrial protein [Klebsiella quasipneumoniae]
MMNTRVKALIHNLRIAAMKRGNGRLSIKPCLLLIISIGVLFIFARPAWPFNANSVVNFNVSGKIEEPVCEVSVKPSSTIDLGTVSLQRLTGKPGASSDATAVAIAFEHCSTGMTSVTITFNGNSYSNTYPSIYQDELIYGAKNVGLQLLSAVDQKSLGPNDTYTYALPEGAERVFNMIARMYTPDGKVTAGKVAFTVTFNVTYK